MALRDDEFRSLDLSPNKSLNMRCYYGRKVYKRAAVHVPTLRPFDQDWPSVRPVARSFHPANVLLPLHHGWIIPIENHLPITITTSDYLNSFPSLSDARARIVITLQVKLSFLKLDNHAKDKFFFFLYWLYVLYETLQKYSEFSVVYLVNAC
ncbi:hypothetical protein DAPPUDRAFT_324195 [Daphnia pulex]|uniref:Uncharacterized protein n=1 Tax=Daphnia pulex TaxID=6669 RepID=E9H0Z4_DAPPU|nr:hypothetical protein DAPPUDRAFT_324195 [Daphnia pulex]|eukprot:EFX74616.1 hypothetical protein DAPPUDRAFT_324195 [Daphnia pulex]